MSKLMLERTVYERDDIKVIYEIDYHKKTISILDNVSNNKNKQYTFANRTVDYMKGWKHILDILKEAIEEAEGKLRACIENEEEENLKQAIKINDMIYPRGNFKFKSEMD